VYTSYTSQRTCVLFSSTPITTSCTGCNHTGGDDVLFSRNNVTVVHRKSTDVSEECVASIFRFKGETSVNKAASRALLAACCCTSPRKTFATKANASFFFHHQEFQHVWAIFSSCIWRRHSRETDFSRILKCIRLCGLVVRVPGYRSTCPSSIAGATRFSEK
jgi:hypothetical protein